MGEEVTSTSVLEPLIRLLAKAVAKEIFAEQDRRRDAESARGKAMDAEMTELNDAMGGQ